VIVDTVDVHFVRELREAELRKDGAARGAAIARRSRELGVYAQADTVVTVTRTDADVLAAHGMRRPIAVVPNIHGAHPEPPPPFASRSGLLFVGGFGHRPNVDAVRWFHAEVFPHVKAEIGDVRLFVVGSSPPDEILSLARPDVVVTGHVPSTTPYLAACRVSVAPLRYGAGMKGKIGEALGHGLPVVSTSIGAEGMQLEDGVHALIADDPRGFAEKVVRLYLDPDLWSRVSENGRSHVDERYGPQAVAPVLRSIIPSTEGTSSLPLMQVA
jgi:glycosyltransferase involved in cell wall biosynthesis